MDIVSRRYCLTEANAEQRTLCSEGMHRSPIIEQYSPFPSLPAQASALSQEPAAQPQLTSSIYRGPAAMQAALPIMPASGINKPSLPQLDTFQIPPGARRINYLQNQMQSIGARQGLGTPIQPFRNNAANLHSTLAGSPALPWSHQQHAVVHTSPPGSKRRPNIIKPGSLPGTALPAHLVAAGAGAGVKGESPLLGGINLQQVERKPSNSPSPGSD